MILNLQFLYVLLFTPLPFLNMLYIYTALFSPQAAAPKQWKAFDGKITEMDTPYTIRAQELRDIYSTLSMKYLTQDERLDVLLTLKHTVKEHDCKLTQEIIELIDREADLLMRGVKESNLEGTFISSPGLLTSVLFKEPCNSYIMFK